MIQLQHLTYGRIKQPLTIVDANIVVQGSCFLFGQSGSGKTTLLEVLCGLSEDNYYGKILYDNKPVEQTSITYLPADVVAFKNKTVLKNLQYACDCAGKPYDIIDLNNEWVSKYASTKLKKLSAFNSAYFALVRARVKDAKFMLIDVSLKGFSDDEIKEYASLLQELLANKNKQIILAVSSEDFVKLNIGMPNLQVLYINAGKLASYNNFNQFSGKPSTLSITNYLSLPKTQAKVINTISGYLININNVSYKLNANYTGGIAKYFEVSDSADVVLVGKLDAGIDDSKLNRLLQQGEVLLYDALSGELLN